MNIIDLTKQLVSIPSWVDKTTNEIKIGEFIYEFLKNYTKLTVKKEMVVNGRFNILASNSQDIKTLVIGHIDTVGINSNWQTDPAVPTIKDSKLYGRGTTDMKSGLAAMMLFTTQKNLPQNIAFLFYIDEEYNFAGIKKFIADYGQKIKPTVIVSLDGSELKIANGCRGLIEISAVITGISCHAANPQNGVNAIEVTIKSVEKLRQFLTGFNDIELGKTSLNLASVKGGKAANIVPDKCQFLLDIRPSSTKLNSQLIINQLSKAAVSYGGKLTSSKVNFDLNPWITPKSELNNLGLGFKDITTSGYIDIQMLWQVFNKPKCFTIGAGSQKAAHISNEYIEIDKLNKLNNILSDIIQKINNVTI